MKTEVNVLNRGFVRLVSYMQPAERGEWCGGNRADYEDDMHMLRHDWTGDLEVVRNARVSHDADWRTGEDEGSDAKLVRSMTNRIHTSPFEAMLFTFELKMPIFVARQWQRHRTWSYNELSARYAPMDEDFYIPAPEMVGKQDSHEKQARNEEMPVSLEIYERNQAWCVDMMKSNQAAHRLYKNLLDGGMPRELARTVLPVSIYTRMFATVDLHNLKHFLTLRQDKHAQYEIRVYADAIFDIVSQIVPKSMLAFDDRRNAMDDLMRFVVDAEQQMEGGVMTEGMLARARSIMKALGLKRG